MIPLLACTWVASSETEACEPRLLEPGEVRAKEVRCSDEVPSGGEGRVGDVLLQNAELVAVIRPWTSLTLVGHGGGGLVDLAPSGGLDTVLEVLPLVDGGWMELEEIDRGTDEEAAWVTIRGTTRPIGFLGGSEGRPVELTWRLPADGAVLEVEGSEELYVHGLLGEATATGLSWEDRALGIPGSLEEDLGGARVFSGSELAAGGFEEVHAAVFPEGVLASGTCDGERVRVEEDGELLALLPAAFEALVPEEATLSCAAEGHADGEPVAPAADLALSPGEEGWLSLRVEDGEGRIPALAWVDGEPWVVDTTGAPLALPPGPHSLVVEHGPAFSTWSGSVEVPGALSVVLARELSSGWISLDLDRETWPSRGSRLDPAVDLERAVGAGHALVVQHARGEVAQPSQALWTAHHARVLAGSLTEGATEVISWPWSSNSRRSGHGAADAEGLGALDRLAVAQGGEITDRFTLVGLDWVEEAGDAWRWSPEPVALRLEGIEDAERVMELLDAGFRPTFVGPVTWSPAETSRLPSEAAALRGLATAGTSAGSGPRLVLEATPRPLAPRVGLSVSLEQGSSGRLATVEVWTDEGLVARYEVADAPVFSEELVVGAGDWAWAIGWSEDDWAVSPAVWLGSDVTTWWRGAGPPLRAEGDVGYDHR